jgi:hypothetical protein
MVLGIALALPGLAAPFAIDDFFHIASLEGAAPASFRWWELYTFSPSDAQRRDMLIGSGALPWWSAPDLKLAFFRPLSSALVALDHSLFGRHVIGWHLHSLLWWAALLVVAGRFYRRVLPAGAAAFALLLFVVDDSHWLPIVWSAARNGLVATVPALLGLAAHVRWREHGWRPGVVLAPLGFAVGLAGGEVALGVLAYVVAFEALGRGRDRWRTRILALAPYVALLAVYAVARAATGAGVAGSASYIDPTRDPLDFARAALGRVPALVGNLVLNIPSELWGGDIRTRPWLAGVGLLAATSVGVWLRSALRSLPPDEARPVRWMAGGALLGLVPGAAAMLGERVLLPSSLGAAAVFAVLLRDGLRRWREARGGGVGRRGLLGVGIALLGVPNLVLAAPLLVGKILLWNSLADRARDEVCRLPLEGPGPIRAVVVWAEEPPLAEFGGGARWFYCRGSLVSWTVLSMAPDAQRLTRTSQTELTLATLGRPLLGSEWEALFRSPDRPMQAGDTVRQQGGLEVSVQAVADGRPTRVLFRFPIRIEGSEFRLLVWRGGRPAALPVPAVGDSVLLGHQR